MCLICVPLEIFATGDTTGFVTAPPRTRNVKVEIYVVAEVNGLFPGHLVAILSISNWFA